MFFKKIMKINGNEISNTKSANLVMIHNKKMCKKGCVFTEDNGILVPKSIKYYKNQKRIGKKQFKKDLKQNIDGNYEVVSFMKNKIKER